MRGKRGKNRSTSLKRPQTAGRTNEPIMSSVIGVRQQRAKMLLYRHGETTKTVDAIETLFSPERRDYKLLISYFI